MNNAQELQEADRRRCLRHHIGERLRAMHADEANRRLPARFLDLLSDFEQVKNGNVGLQGGLKKAIAGGAPDTI
jgi:hypothetical protein